MTDKEVGELWRNHGDGKPLTHLHCAVCDLTRKLVEERKQHKKISHDAYEGREGVGLYCKECSYTDGDWENEALRDFGINSEEW